MNPGGQTPEELETLLEDACLLRDSAALAGLFEEDGLLVRAALQSRGRAEIARACSLIWDPGDDYLAETNRIFQARRTVLIIGDNATSVATRGCDGTWRYAISVHSITCTRRQK